MPKAAKFSVPQAAFSLTGKRRKRIAAREATAPLPPLTTRECVVTASTALIRWQGRTGETYELFRATENDFDAAESVADSITTNGQLDTGLEAETDYWYWIKATNEAGTSDESLPIEITTLPAE